MRLFVALDLPAEVRRNLARIQKELAPIPLPVRWVRPEGIHLTLRFIGEVAPERLEAIRAGLAGEVGEGIAPYELEVAGVGTFPPRGAPRVLWLGVGGDIEATRGLKRQIDAALRTAGIPPDSRELKPHLTLGRVKGPARGDWRSALERLESVRAGRFGVREVLLFESRLGPEGATYRSLAAFRLRGETTR